MSMRSTTDWDTGGWRGVLLHKGYYRVAIFFCTCAELAKIEAARASFSSQQYQLFPTSFARLGAALELIIATGPTALTVCLRMNVSVWTNGYRFCCWISGTLLLTLPKLHWKRSAASRLDTVHIGGHGCCGKLKRSMKISCLRFTLLSCYSVVDILSSIFVFIYSTGLQETSAAAWNFASRWCRFATAAPVRRIPTTAECNRLACLFEQSLASRRFLPCSPRECWRLWCWLLSSERNENWCYSVCRTLLLWPVQLSSFPFTDANRRCWAAKRGRRDATKREWKYASDIDLSGLRLIVTAAANSS